MPSATDLKATSLSSLLVTSPPSAALESLHMSPRTEGAPSSTTQGQSSDDESGPNNTMNMMHLQADDAFALDALPPIAAAAEPPSPKCCSYCRTTQTPMWRHGPVGFDPLCNGCGVKWKRGRILAGLERAPRSPVVKKQKNSGTKAAPVYKTDEEDVAELKRRPLPLVQRHYSVPHIHSSAIPANIIPKRTRTASAGSILSPSLQSALLVEPLPSLAINTTIHNERRQMLLKSVLEKSPLLSPSPIDSMETFWRHSISSPVDLIGSPMRGAFVCAALESLESSEGLKVVADAVRLIQRRNSIDSVNGSSSCSSSTTTTVSTPEMVEEEIEVDVGALDAGEWEYLCGVLVSVG